MGDLGGEMPLGSWVLVHGKEKKAVLQSLCQQEALDRQVREVQKKTVPNEGGHPIPLWPFIVADAKAQVALGGCDGWNSVSLSAVVCWLCGHNREMCLQLFGEGEGKLLETFEWTGVCLPSIPPSARPPDYGLHGVHRVVVNGLHGLLGALQEHHGWSKGRACRWVQFYLNPVRLAARTAGPQECEQIPSDLTSLRLEQGAAAEWVKVEGWDCIIQQLVVDRLLQTLVEFEGAMVPWTDAFRAWGEGVGVSAAVAWQKGVLVQRDVAKLDRALKCMGRAHTACYMDIVLWVHLWVDHMVPWAKRWGSISAFAAFKGEGRHQPLKAEIRKRSFKGGAKKGKLGRTRRRGHRVGRTWREVIRGDNLDWGLYAQGFSVWQKSWTKQEAYKRDKQFWKQR